MNFDLDDDQKDIQRTAREFLAARYRPEEVRRLALEDARGFTDEQWREMAGLGWPGLALPEEVGGSGLGMIELAVVAEELGHALAPTPLQATWVAGFLLQAAGETEWLARLADGSARGAAPVDAGGDALLVPQADAADVLVTADRAIGAGAFSARPLESLDPTRRMFEVRVTGEGASLPGAIDGGLDRVLVMVAAESVGIAQRCLEMSVEYAKERKQFDRPIGSFQAVSHQCAQMLLETENARALVYNAAWALEHDPQQAPLATAMAKAYASDAGVRCAELAIQVHGGIGMTWEHDLHFFLKRAQWNAHVPRAAGGERARVADLVGL
ncbi:MAG TPA: acyl-CoA dehydrogenase family protein [Solirubrobacteraceae bacterium]|nr:acyl-CoA dehydrogenase family protein [Solirubrobacteraceae bacterium]